MPPIEVSWPLILGNWAAVEVGLHRHYGIDVESDVLQHRSWRWLVLRIFDLITISDSRLRAVLQKHAIDQAESEARQ